MILQRLDTNQSLKHYPGKLSNGSYIVTTNGRGAISEAQVKKLHVTITQKYNLLLSKDISSHTKTLVFSAGEEKQLKIQGVGEVKFKLESNKLSASLNEGDIQEAELKDFEYRGKKTKSYKVDFNKELEGKTVRVANLTVKPSRILQEKPSKSKVVKLTLRTSKNKYNAVFTTYPHAETNMRRYAISQNLKLTHSGSDKPTCYLCAVAHTKHKTTFGDITKESPNWTPLNS